MSHDSMENSNIFPLKFQSVSVGFPCGKSSCIRLGCAPGGFAGAILQAWRPAAALTPILAVCYTELPRTYEELKADADLIKAKGYIPVAVGAADDWVNSDLFVPISNQITYQGEVDGKLQQQSIDEVNSYVSNAVGNRKLQNSELETAIVVAMQNVAAGSDPLTELQTVQDVAESLR